MSKSGVGIATVFILYCFSAVGCATTENSQQKTLSTVETGVLQPVEGYRGDVLGAEILSVTPIPDSTARLIEVSVPISPDQVDRVTVVSPSGQSIMFDSGDEVTVRDDKDRVGIFLKLPGNNKLGFRIKLIDLAND